VRDVIREFLRIRLRRAPEEIADAVERTSASCFPANFLSTRRSAIVDNLAKFVHKHMEAADDGAEIVNDGETAPRLS
jgi:hypothetical protein